MKQWSGGREEGGSRQGGRQCSAKADASHGVACSSPSPSPTQTADTDSVWRVRDTALALAASDSGSYFLAEHFHIHEAELRHLHRQLQPPAPPSTPPSSPSSQHNLRRSVRSHYLSLIFNIFMRQKCCVVSSRCQRQSGEGGGVKGRGQRQLGGGIFYCCRCRCLCCCLCCRCCTCQLK